MQFEFIEDEDKDTRTKMEVFQRFTLGIPVFDGGTSAYPIEARLKYREREESRGHVLVRAHPPRPRLQDRGARQLARIKDGTGFPVICGKP